MCDVSDLATVERDEPDVASEVRQGRLDHVTFGDGTRQVDVCDCHKLLLAPTALNAVGNQVARGGRDHGAILIVEEEVATGELCVITRRGPVGAPIRARRGHRWQAQLRNHFERIGLHQRQVRGLAGQQADRNDLAFAVKRDTRALALGVDGGNRRVLTEWSSLRVGIRHVRVVVDVREVACRHERVLRHVLECNGLCDCNLTVERHSGIKPPAVRNRAGGCCKRDDQCGHHGDGQGEPKRSSTRRRLGWLQRAIVTSQRGSHVCVSSVSADNNVWRGSILASPYGLWLAFLAFVNGCVPAHVLGSADWWPTRFAPHSGDRLPDSPHARIGGERWRTQFVRHSTVASSR